MRNNNKDHEVKSLTYELLNTIKKSCKSRCISIYQPTHRKHPEHLQDIIRFKKLLKELELTCKRSLSSLEVQEVMKPFEDLAKDQEFWKCNLDGLAIFSSRDFFQTVKLPVKLSELVLFSNGFHIKPLFQYLQSLDRYQVLGLSLNQVKLYEGNRHSLVEVELISNMLQKSGENLNLNIQEKNLTARSHGDRQTYHSGMFHGHGDKSDISEIEGEKFFRAVDRAILNHYSGSSGLPLILAALPEHHHLFKKISHNPNLLVEPIPYNPESISLEELKNLAWQIVEPYYQDELTGLTDEFEQARSHKIGSDDLFTVAKATVTGRVNKLLIEADRFIGGQLDVATGHVKFSNLNHPIKDDLLDDLGQQVTRLGGQVRVIPAEQMPSKSGIAATFRY